MEPVGNALIACAHCAGISGMLLALAGTPGELLVGLAIAALANSWIEFIENNVPHD